MGKKGKTVVADGKKQPSMSTSSSTTDSNVFYVEEIQDEKKTRDGKIFYLVKWKDYPVSDNTWEPKDGLMCFRLIEEFEQRKQNKDESRRGADPVPAERVNPFPMKGKRRAAPDNHTKTGKRVFFADTPKSGAERDDDDEPPSAKMKIMNNGFDQGWTVDKIIGAHCNKNGQVEFVVKFKGHEPDEIIKRDICNIKCPLKVIAFYEEKLTWHTPNLHQ